MIAEFLLLFALPVFADDNFKVIGRGVADKQTGEKLQMACVGNVIEYSNERSCDQLQFLYQSQNQSSKLVGPIFSVDSESDSKVRKQILKQLDYFGLSLDASSQYKFMFTRGVYGKGTAHSGKGAQYIMAVGSIGVVGTAVNLTTTLSSGPQLLVILAAGFASPIILDIAFFPIEIILDWTSRGGVYGFDVRSVKSLQDHAKYSWQFKPKGLKSNRFQDIYKSLTDFLSYNEVCARVTQGDFNFTQGKKFIFFDKENNQAYELEYVNSGSQYTNGYVSFKTVEGNPNPYIKSYSIQSFLDLIGCTNTKEEATP